MLAEHARVVEATFEIPVASLALRSLVGGLGVVAVLAIYYIRCAVGVEDDVASLVILHERVERSHATVTLLVDGECRVVRAFHLEAQALGDEVEFLVEHEVHLQLVDVSLHETVAVVCHTRAAEERKVETVGIVSGAIYHLAVNDTWA